MTYQIPLYQINSSLSCFYGKKLCFQGDELCALKISNIMGCACCKQRKASKAVSNPNSCDSGNGTQASDPSRYIPDPTFNPGTGMIPNFNDFSNLMPAPSSRPAAITGV